MPLWSRIAATFAAVFGGYLLLAGSLSASELAAGFGVAAAVTAFAAFQRLRTAQPLRLPLPPWRLVARTGAGLATDCLRVGAALARTLARPAEGRAEWQGFDPGSSAPADRGRRALVNLAASLAPNGFVLDLRPSAHPRADAGLLLHRLVPTRPMAGRDWPA